MGKLVLAAKVTHVPSLMLSEIEGSPLRQARENAVRALRELGRRARDRRVTTFVVFDTHWLSNFGYHINANPQHRGSFTSHEAPHMIQDLRYDLPGDSTLARAIASEARDAGLNVIAHRVFPRLPQRTALDLRQHQRRHVGDLGGENQLSHRSISPVAGVRAKQQRR